MKILVTGVAGFIGMHVAKRLIDNGFNIIGIDNLNEYYDIDLKKARLAILKINKEKFKFIKIDIVNKLELDEVFKKNNINIVIHLAAQAGVRYSIENPKSYIDSNIYGFLNILESCRNYKVEHLIFASSSSVYGLNVEMPFNENHTTDHPLALYGATKKSNEVMAHSYSHLYNIACTGLRFFTVYGPWGRPDMALFIFTKAILNNQPIEIFNNGNMIRDFTYIKDIVDGITALLFKPGKSIVATNKNFTPSKSSAPYNIFNIGGGKRMNLLHFIELLENAIGKKAIKQMLPAQLGDVQETYADISSIKSWVGFEPKVSTKEGVENFVNWYKTFYK